jgi:beta-lactamase class C
MGIGGFSFRAAVIGVFLAGASLEGAAAAVDAPPAGPFEQILDAAFATGDFVGLSVAVVRDGETVLLRTYGARETGGEPVTPKTVFRIASLSKGFTASLAALAFSDGLLSESGSATAHAPELSLRGGAEKSLTIGHLLSHRTGLPPNAYDNLLEEGAAPEEILAKYRDVALVCPVGSCYAYQNIAFDIVGRALSAAYGEPFAELVAERLFVPLGMESASVGEAALSAAGNVARPHKRDRLPGGAPARYGPWRVVPVKSAYYKIPAAGGLNASILDMAEWLKAQMGGRPEVLPPAALALLHAPRVSTPAETARIRPVSTRYAQTQYGYGWRLYAYDGKPVITHSGTVDGYAAQIAILPTENVGIVILSNAQSRRFWRLLPTFLDIEFDLPREDWLALNDDAPKAGSP